MPADFTERLKHEFRVQDIRRALSQQANLLGGAQGRTIQLRAYDRRLSTTPSSVPLILNSRCR